MKIATKLLNSLFGAALVFTGPLTMAKAESVKAEGAGAGVAGAPVTVLTYMDREQGGEPFMTRVLVGERFLRIDFGDDNGDFVLFDRESLAIQNVVHDSRTVLDIPRYPINIAAPIPLSYDVLSQPASDAPTIAGQTVDAWRFTVNGQVCATGMSVAGVAADAVAALRDYQLTLAGQQAQTLGQLPAEMMEPCGLAIHVFRPTMALEAGLTLQASDAEGRQRMLVDIDTTKRIERALFDVPLDYRHYGI